MSLPRLLDRAATARRRCPQSDARRSRTIGDPGADRGRRGARPRAAAPAARRSRRTSRSSARRKTASGRWSRSPRSRPTWCSSTSRCPGCTGLEVAASLPSPAPAHRLLHGVRSVRRRRVRAERGGLPAQAGEPGAPRARRSNACAAGSGRMAAIDTATLRARRRRPGSSRGAARPTASSRPRGRCASSRRTA